jgi:hypothetical protein
MVLSNGTHNGFGSASTLYKIETEHYNGDSHTGSTLDLFPKGAPFANALKQLYRSPDFSFSNLSTAQTREALMEYTLTPYAVDQEGTLRFVISPNAAGPKFTVSAEDLRKYGAMVLQEENMENMDGWLALKQLIEYVQPNEEIGLSEFAEHKIDYSRFGMTDVDLHVKDFSGMVPMNKFGLYLSLIANAEQDFRELIFANYIKERPGHNRETLALLEALIEEGFEPREIEAIGVEDLSGKGYAAVAYTTNGTAILVASKDIGEWASRVAEAHGLTGAEAAKFVKRAIWYHELYHVYDQRKGVSKTDKEIDVGEFLAEFFGTRGSMLEGKVAEYYKALKKLNKDYAQDYRDGTIKVPDKNSLSSMVKALVSKYASEAIKIGLEGKEAEDYVASRLEQEIKDLEESKNSEADTAKDSKYDTNAKTKTDTEDSGNESHDCNACSAETKTDDGVDGDSEGGEGE